MPSTGSTAARAALISRTQASRTERIAVRTWGIRTRSATSRREGRFRARVEPLGGCRIDFSYTTTHAPTVNVRTTAEGCYTLTQTFVRDVTERELVIAMTLRNNGPGPVRNVALQRAADLDAGGTRRSNGFLRSYDSIATADAYFGVGLGMMMSVSAPGIPHSTAVAAYSDFTDIDSDSCAVRFPRENPLPPDDDYVRVIRSQFGDLAAGQSKTAKIVHRRF